MSLTLNKTQINFERLVLSKDEKDVWHAYYIQYGKLWHMPLTAPHFTFNSVTDAVRRKYSESSISDAAQWVEVNDAGVLKQPFFRMKTGNYIHTNDLREELKHFGEAVTELAVSNVEQEDSCAGLAIRFPKYWKALPNLWKAIDTYRVNELFPIHGDDSGRLLHARKKLLVPGTRTGGKSLYTDIAEAHATLGAWLADNAPEKKPMCLCGVNDCCTVCAPNGHKS